MSADGKANWLRVIVFDLDDTLYPELTYILSGFSTVAAALGVAFGLDRAAVEIELAEELNAKGRGSVFDAILRRRGLYTAQRVKQCISVYRRHRPRITLFPDAVDCLNHFIHLPRYVITDGHKGVQARKASALGLSRLVQGILITHRFGRSRAKPSPYCALKVCEREKVAPDSVLVVADDPHKDFVHLRPLGFRTVRVRRGRLVGVTLNAAHEADEEIENLSELNDALLERFGRSVSRPHASRQR
jgi:putative hydrolase of the HAD superfamily